MTEKPIQMNLTEEQFNMIIVTTDKEDDIGFVVGYVQNPDNIELPVKK